VISSIALPTYVGLNIYVIPSGEHLRSNLLERKKKSEKRPNFEIICDYVPLE
jgi:hypothetical protein